MPPEPSRPRRTSGLKFGIVSDCYKTCLLYTSFIADHSAATVSASASARAHRALQYLLENQGLSFRRFGLNIVAWNVQTGAIPVPLNEGDSAVDEDEDLSLIHICLQTSRCRTTAS